MSILKLREPHAVFIAILLAFLVGCLPVEVVDEPEPHPVETEVPEEPPEPDPVLVAPPDDPQPEEPLPPPTIPTVNLTEALRATSLVEVNDRIPEGELPDLDGQMHAIHEVLGDRLTIVLFWHSGNMHSVVQLEDLARDMAGPLSARGGRIIAINVGDTPEKAAAAARKAGADFLVLRDPDKTYFEKVATERMPRTYVLDAEGTILWFDLEYSRSTRRDLELAVNVVLDEEPQQ